MSCHSRQTAGLAGNRSQSSAGRRAALDSRLVAWRPPGMTKGSFIFAKKCERRPAQSGRGETGRRKGLKIPRLQGCAGSTPAVRTNKINDLGGKRVSQPRLHKLSSVIRQQKGRRVALTAAFANEPAGLLETGAGGRTKGQLRLAAEAFACNDGRDAESRYWTKFRGTLYRSKGGQFIAHAKALPVTVRGRPPCSRAARS